MTFVVDACFAAAWALPDERSGETDVILDLIDRRPAAAPSLFWHELRSVLWTAERRGRIPVGAAVALTLRLRQIPVEDAGQGEDAEIFRLAATHALSPYDAAYLSLAFTEAKRAGDAGSAVGRGRETGRDRSPRSARHLRAELGLPRSPSTSSG
jgi:predicted nucleic acid-binding protein